MTTNEKLQLLFNLCLDKGVDVGLHHGAELVDGRVFIDKCTFIFRCYYKGELQDYEDEYFTTLDKCIEIMKKY